MRLMRELLFRVKWALLGVFGPATLDEEHDPIVQLKREHEREVREEELSREEDG
jgi:hypothetical protein